MTRRSVAVCAILAALLAGVAVPAPGTAAGAEPLPGVAVRATVTAPAPAAARTISPSPAFAALAAGTLTPAQAVSQAHSDAAEDGITDYVSVVDSHTGAVLAQSGNAGTQVASESIVKLMIASYYLVLEGGYQYQSPSVLSRLSYMIRYSDDATASAYFTSAAVPTIADRYGMGSTINATDRVGHWGAVRITAHDMTTFLYRALHDPEVGPWLGPVMAQVAPVGSDGFNQDFGMNSLTGVHGSKQGWGDDQFWTSAQNVINSVGYTDRYLVAILQNSYSYPDPARATSSYAARIIAASRNAAPRPPQPPPPPQPPRNGDFVSSPAAPGIYRLAGGAPIYVSSWAPFGRPQPVKRLSRAQWRALRTVPADGTFIRTTNNGGVFRIAGGAPLYVSDWIRFGGVQPAVTVDNAAVLRAGRGGVWSHLRYRPADGTYVSATTTHQVFRIDAGTPTFVTSLARFGGVRPTTVVDGADMTHAGRPGVWSHLLNTLPDGIFIYGVGTRQVFRMAGGAPIFIGSWATFGGPKPVQYVDAEAIRLAGYGGKWSHLRSVPVTGTFIRGGHGGAVYRVAGGAPLYAPSPGAIAAHPLIITVDRAALDHTGRGGPWAHLRQYPVPGTVLRGVPGNRLYRVIAGRAGRVATALRPLPVNQVTIDRAGAGGPYNHLKK